MPAGFLDDSAKRAFADAVQRIEGASAAEVVVAVRIRSARWLHAYVAIGGAAAVAAHGFMLFSAHPFSLSSIFVDPIVAGVGAGFAAGLVRPLGRWMTPARHRRAAVRIAAQSTFYDKGISQTRGRTGLLVYLSIVEQMAEVVVDSGVRQAVPAAEWQRAVAAIDAAVADGGAATAQAVAALAPLLAAALPRGADDINELPDEVST